MTSLLNVMAIKGMSVRQLEILEIVFTSVSSNLVTVTNVKCIALVSFFRAVGIVYQTLTCH